MSAPNWELLIENGMVVTLAGEEFHRPGYVAVKGGLIDRVGPMSDLGLEDVAVRTLDAGGGIVMPGLVNGHTHAAMTVFRGLADDLPLMSWLNEHIFPAEAAHVNEDLVYWGSKLAFAEMLLSGTTCLADGYFLEHRAATAAAHAGIRGVFGQGVIDFPAPGVPLPSMNVQMAALFIDSYHRHPLLKSSVFCHSPYTCSRETLVEAKELARSRGVLFQIHVSETAGEVERMRAERGLTPVAWLDSLGVLDENTLAVHAVHVDEADMDILAERRSPVCLCPESNMKLASGLAPARRMAAGGVRLALGTDGPASNNDLNMFGEMRTLALAAKGLELDPTALPAFEVLEIATAGGAQALGWPDLGRLTPGAPADIVVCGLDRPNMIPMFRPGSHLVYAASGQEVRTVVVGGKVVVENRRVLTFDVEEARRKVIEIAGRIR